MTPQNPQLTLPTTTYLRLERPSSRSNTIPPTAAGEAPLEVLELADLDPKDWFETIATVKKKIAEEAYELALWSYFDLGRQQR